MKHTSKKLLATMLTLIMIVSMFGGLSASATEVDTVTVYFTQGNTEGTNYGESWIGGGSNLFTFGSTTVEIDLIDLQKTYIPSGTTDPMGGDPSVLDAIITAAANRNLYDVIAGWDAYPWEGDPGAYLSNVNNTTLTSNNWVDEDGINHATGTGFYVTVASDGLTTPSFPTEYVSNVPVYDGMVIYVDLGSYSYTW
jgi:hypothetical protein